MSKVFESGTAHYTIIKDTADNIRTIDSARGELVEEEVGGGSNDHVPLTVANAAARKALTGLVAGAHVKEADTGMTYGVVDAGNLASDAGWEIIALPNDVTITGNDCEINIAASSSTEHTFPLLQSHRAFTISIQNSSDIQSLSFPRLEEILVSGKIDIINNSSLAELLIPRLARLIGLAGILDIRQNNALESIAFPILAELNDSADLHIREHNLLAALSFPELESVLSDAGLFIRDNPLLASLSLPEFTTLGGGGIHGYPAYLNFSGNALVSLDISALATVIGSSELVAGGNALPQSQIDALLSTMAAAVTAGGATGGYIDLSGGTSAAPTGGDDNLDVVSLVAAGWTVLHN